MDKLKEKTIPFWKTKKIIFIIITAVLIRLLLMPITLHPDLLGHSFSAYFLAYEGKINPYDTLSGLPANHPLVKNFGVGDIFIYPPLTYYTLGLFRFIVKPFIDPNFIPWLWSNLDKIHQYPGLFANLFLFKLPYLFFDVGLAFIMAGLFHDKKKKQLAFTLWLFNPLSIYVPYMIGQLDLLPTFFSVLGIYFFQKRKFNWSAFLIGIATSYKMYPLFLLFPLAFLAKDKFWERIKLIVIGVLPFVFFIAPYLNSPSFRNMVFSPKSQKMLYMGWPLSGAEVVFPFLLILVLIYYYLYYTRKKIPVVFGFLSVLLLIYSVTHFHPQWFLWVTPFLIWELVENNFKHWVIILSIFLCWLTITLFFEPSLSYGLFNPIFPWLDKAVGLSDIVGKYTNVFQLKSMIRSVLAGSSLFLIIDLFREKNEA